MGSGAFNVAQLIAELGLKPVVGEDAMRVLNSIQPTMSVGSLQDTTPPHVPPSALFGAFEATGVGVFSNAQIQCLAPGGAFVDWIETRGITPIEMRVVTVDPGATTILATAGQVSRDPIVSIARHDPVALIPTPGVFIEEESKIFRFGSHPIFVPRGSFFALTAFLANLTFSWGLGWREVPSSEFVPS